MLQNILYKKRRFKLFCKFLLVGMLLQSAIGCKTLNVIRSQAEKLDTSKVEKVDEEVLKMINPYKLQLDSSMEIELAILETDLIKEQPESTLGNHIAEITYWCAQKNYNNPIDFSICNYGGLRVPYINKGTLKVKDAYQIMPFDNYVVIMKAPGYIIQQLLDRIALNGGWPVYQLNFKIKDGKAIDIKIKDQNFDPGKEYTFGLTDYLANGGDDLSFLKDFQHTNTNVYLRDAIIDYWKDQFKKNQNIQVFKDGRIKLADE